MNYFRILLLITAWSFAFIFEGCSSGNDYSEHPESHATEHEGEHDEDHKTVHETKTRDEHDRDEGEHHGEEGEESGTELKLTLDETYDQVRKGAHLVLAYNEETNSFVGLVKNVTEKTLENVRVEVHLSNGLELGPTMPVDLEAGESLDIVLAAINDDFTAWTAHPEVGDEEHEHEGEGEGEHEGRGEHH